MAIPLCEEHGEKLAEYCVTCGMAVCAHCVRYGNGGDENKHQGHKLKLTKNLAGELRIQLNEFASQSKVFVSFHFISFD